MEYGGDAPIHLSPSGRRHLYSLDFMHRAVFCASAVALYSISAAVPYNVCESQQCLLTPNARASERRPRRKTAFTLVHSHALDFFMTFRPALLGLGGEGARQIIYFSKYWRGRLTFWFWL